MKEQDNPQLDLFSWHIIKTGRGFEYLVSLDFVAAREAFSSVLDQYPLNGTAIRAMDTLNYWECVCSEAEEIGGKKGVSLLWQNIKSYAFDKGHSLDILMPALCGRVSEMMDKDPLMFIPPDICLGNVRMQAGDYKGAEEAFRKLIDNNPLNGMVSGRLADALFMQNRKYEARIVYARALLKFSCEISIEEIKDNELSEVIEDTGIKMAAIEGWLKGILPLLDWAREKEGIEKMDESHEAYSLLHSAQRAKSRGLHKEMVASRGRLKERFPDIFKRYMERA